MIALREQVRLASFSKLCSRSWAVARDHDPMVPRLVVISLSSGRYLGLTTPDMTNPAYEDAFSPILSRSVSGLLGVFSDI